MDGAWRASVAAESYIRQRAGEDRAWLEERLERVKIRPSQIAKITASLGGPRDISSDPLITSYARISMWPITVVIALLGSLVGSALVVA